MLVETVPRYLAASLSTNPHVPHLCIGLVPPVELDYSFYQKLRNMGAATKRKRQLHYSFLLVLSEC